MSAPNVKFLAIHAVVGNAPQIVVVAGEDGIAYPRFFRGSGSPPGALMAGNGKFNGIASGWIVSVSLLGGNAGSGYSVGDVLPVSGGTVISGGSALQITVDAVSSSGAIIGWHVSTAGGYSAFPPQTSSVTGGTGSNAQFTMVYPQPDHYYDITTPASPNLWVCTTAGSYSTSVWYNLSGCP